jgi:hypothetical protein
VLANIGFNLLGPLISDNVLVTLRRMLGSTSRTKAPNKFVGGSNNDVLRTIVFTKIIVVPNIQLIVMFHLVTILCEGGGTRRGGGYVG